MSIKDIMCILSGMFGGVFAELFGAGNGAVTTLLILMGMDYISGMLAAVVFGKSRKSENGGLESKAGWKGIIRKGITLIIVIAAYRLDLLIGTDYVENAVVIAFCANECISLIENAALMGVPIPEQITNAIDILKKTKDAK